MIDDIPFCFKTKEYNIKSGICKNCDYHEECGRR